MLLKMGRFLAEHPVQIVFYVLIMGVILGLLITVTAMNPKITRERMRYGIAAYIIGAVIAFFASIAALAGGK